jgi:hypothetical protein
MQIQKKIKCRTVEVYKAITNEGSFVKQIEKKEEYEFIIEKEKKALNWGVTIINLLNIAIIFIKTYLKIRYID